jgi:hypothetical protein
MISELNGHKQHMHYVDFDSKNKQTIIRFAIYVVLGLVAFGISLLVIFAARGYDVDPATGKVVRNGLVLMWSQPESVDVYVNNQLEDSTPSRLPLPVGKYDLKMSKAGYRDWNKTVNVRASEVIKLNYPRLFPNEINAIAQETFETVGDWLQSPDQETIAVHEKAGSPEISLFSIVEPDQPLKKITIPEGFLTRTNGQIGTINLHQWSADSDYLMIEHINGTVTEYIRINVVKNEFVNINTVVSLPITNLQFDRSENNKMYALTDGQLRRINVEAKTISAALVAEVADYRVAADGRVVIIQKRDQISSVIVLEDNDQPRTLLSGPATKSAQLELGNYDGEDYVVTSIDPNEVRLVWLDDDENRPRNLLATIAGKDSKIYPVSFTGRFAVMTSGDIVTVHDFEKLRVFQYKFAGLTPESLSWFDDGHLITTTSAGSIDVIEFDGLNKTTIGQGLKFKVYTDKEFQNYYSLGKNAQAGVNLNSSNLRP